MHRSYVSKDWLDVFLKNPRHPLPKDALVRFLSVLRIKPDEEVAVFDGCGREVRGVLSSSKEDETFMRFTFHQQARNAPEIILAQACLDDTKIAETIKRGCEFGVDQFIIFDAERSDKFCFDKIAKKISRHERLAQDACRQSGRFFIPEIHLWPSLKKVIEFYDSSNNFGVFGDVKEKNLLSTILRNDDVKNKQSFFIVVGPEGGLSDDECAMLKTASFKSVSWSPFVLRSELASLAAIAILNAFSGRA